MKNDLFFESSDGWLFATIQGSKKLSLFNIISSGDMLNHAIFNLDEINDGLSRLESEDYIEIKGSCVQVKDKSKLFIKNHKIRSEGGISEQVRFSNIFSKIPLSNRVIYKQYFSSEDYGNAIKKYCKY